MTWLYWLHFVFLAVLVTGVASLTWLARVYDRD